MLTLAKTSNRHLELTTRDDRKLPWRINSKTATDWFCAAFPNHSKVFGSPFLENQDMDNLGLPTSTPLVPNVDFFAGCLGGDERLGHRVIYYPEELQFYFLDPVDGKYHATTDQKLGNLYRALMARCASEVAGEAHLVEIFHTFRSDKITKSIVDRAKSLLEADPSFFSVDSQHERVMGPELHQRLARVFAGRLLKLQEGGILTVSEAFKLYNKFASARKESPIRRSDFKCVMAETIRDAYGLGVRNDLVNAVTQKQQSGWLGLRPAQLSE